MIKKLISCIREYTLPTILSPVFMIAEAVFEVLIPFFLSDLIDLGIKAGDMQVITQIGTKLILLSCASLFCGIMGGYVSSVASAGFAKNLQHDMYHNIQRFSFSDIDKFSPAGLITRMTTDVTNVQMAFMMCIRMAFRAPTMAIFALVMAFKINSRLAMTFIVVLPVLAAGLIIIIRRGFPMFEKMFKIYDRLNNVVRENIRGIRVVKAFVREDYETEKFRSVSKELYDTNVKAEIIMAFNSPVMEFSMYSCMILISWIGAKLVVSSTMTTGELMSTFTYVMQILMSLMMFSFVIVMFVIAGAAAKRIVEVLSQEPAIKNCDNPVTEVKDGSVRFENVGFAFRGTTNYLHDINLEIKSGEVIGVVGGTGSGKSALMQLIPRLYEVTEGRILVGGNDIRNIDMDVLRKNVSMVIQKNLLFAGTVKENLRWGNPDATDEQLINACKIAQADGFVRELDGGYDSMIEQGGANVSGGQRQRLCIARAILANPKVIIMDDSTSAVDTHTEHLIFEGFKQALPDTTKIVIAQRISSVRNADRIVVMDNGRINAVGTHDELLASNRIYQEIYASQMKGGDFDEPR